MIRTTRIFIFALCIGLLCVSPQFGFCQNESWIVNIIPEDELGEKLIVEGTVLLPDGVTPAAGARIWVFQTDAEGYYKKSDDGEEQGWRKARISRVFHAGPEGQFEIHTIKPGGYPDGPTPKHIHFRISTSEKAEREHTIFFADDERLTTSFKARVEREKPLYLVELSTGENQILMGKVDLIFE